jgi:hypothetical protein
MSDGQTVYVDDSGTDGKSKVAAAAFCVSTVEKWLALLDSWKAIAKQAGFDLKYFHTTEFAACRQGHLCQQCLNGHTSVREHPWQKWTDAKRENVLNRMAKAVVKHVEYGVGQAFTKEDYDQHVRNSPARALASEPIGDEYVTFAVQRCGGSFTEWRAANRRLDQLKFVFDTCSDKEKHEIASVFFAALKDKMERLQGGVEQWFETGREGVSFESRKKTYQLLAADMLAWTTATIRARQWLLEHEKRVSGRFVEAFWLGKVFLRTEHIKIGYASKDALAQWEKDKLSQANT